MDAIQIPKSSLVFFRAIADMEAAQLGTLTGELSGPESPMLRTSQVRDKLQPHFGDQTPAIVRQLLALYQLGRDKKLGPHELVASLTRSIAPDALADGLTDAQWNRWRTNETQLIGLFSIEGLDTTSRAVELAYEYENLFIDAAVTTDIRPVFDRQDSSIRAAVVSQALRLTFDSADREHTLTVAVDQADLILLRDACDAAIRRGVIARDLMHANDIRAQILGDDHAD